MTRYAIIIGIAEYQNLMPLPKAAEDAEAVAQLLEKYSDFEVTRLPHRRNSITQRLEIAPKQLVDSIKLGQALQNLLLERGKGKEVLIYFAGHGLTFTDNLGEIKGALAASDCQLERQGEQIIDYKYGMAFSSLNNLIKKSDLSSLTLVLDCCHSGFFLESELLQETLNTFKTQRDYYLITGCRSFETAKVFKGESHSIFTGALLKGLSLDNAAKNGKISGDRLFDFISNELRGSVQEPIRMGWGKAITLVNYPEIKTTIESVILNQKNPYQGLASFELEQKHYFFGRHQVIRTLITHLSNSRFLPIIGYSGSGKSSLVKAGLFAELESDRIPESSQWKRETFTPGQHPFGKLVNAISKYSNNETYLIFIDQFEEVFTLCESEDERLKFFQLIAEEIKSPDKKSKVILAIRGDFLERCSNYSDIVNLINQVPPVMYVVQPMSLEELEEVIEQPAQLHGVKFERGLVSQIALDLMGQRGALPLLQYALQELWRVCIEEIESHEAILTKQGYEQIGGVKGALNNRANLIYENFSPADQLLVRELFMKLVKPGEGEEVTRQRIPWERLRAISNSPEQLQRVIEILAGSQQRLIITDEKTVEVAHEALLSEWKLLKNWIEEDREIMRVNHRFETAFQEWQESFKKSDQALLMGARLLEVQEWIGKIQPKLTPDERAFFQNSLEQYLREQQAEVEQERQLREAAEAKAKAESEKAIAEMEKAMIAEEKAEVEAARTKEAEAKVKVQKQRTKLIMLSSVLVVFTLALGLVTTTIEGEKREREASSISAYITRAEELLKNHNQLEAAIASIEALGEMKKLNRENQDELKRIQSVINNVQERNRFQVSKGGVYAVDFSANGNYLVAGGFDKKISIIDLKKQVALPSFTAHDDIIKVIKFHPEQQLFASGSLDSKVKLWNLQGKLIHSFNSSDKVYDISFSKTNDLLAAVGKDGTIMIWNTKNYNLFKKIEPPKLSNDFKNPIHGIDFHPKNSSILATTGTNNYDIFIWNLKSKNSSLLPQSIIGQDKGMRVSVKFNQSGSMIVSCSQNSIKIRNLSGEIIGKINDDNALIYAEFSPNDKFIISVTMNEIIKIWDVQKALELWKNKQEILNNPKTIIEVNTGSVNRAVFNPVDSLSFASASEDGTVRKWNLNQNILNSSSPTSSKIINFESVKINELIENSCIVFDNFFIFKSELKAKKARQICNNVIK
ncbi:caspase family protein [Planktothrix agardhii 1801]|jgi:WD40 repeat protein/phage terminase Nu1 subunit (DNA packaging protein)|uniref:nSTAND1 domain-containing NTPase n=1 Tax=Planktothrix agardhii TaxID=1160 RepID=UPI001F45C135|nr:caspase family protein [Planktothrix agardhii]MCF3627132.1 caspase family protein [Planktothrix agardhii 1801]